MKLASYLADGCAGFGVVVNDGVITMNERLGGRAANLKEALALGLIPQIAQAAATAEPDRKLADIAFLPDIRDLAETRRRYAQSRQIGFTAGVTFYPPHVEIVNEIFGPAPADVADAELVATEYEAALAAGNPAVQLAGGRVLLVHDYEKALKVRKRAAAVAAVAAGVKL